LQILYDTEKNIFSQKSSFFINETSLIQVSNNDVPDLKLSTKIVTTNAWLKLYDGNLVYGFTLQNNSTM